MTTTLNPQIQRHKPRQTVWRLLLCLIAVVTAANGCHMTAKPIAMRPARHSIRSGQLLVLSDFRLLGDDPIIQDLVKLRKQVAVVLNLPVQKEEVVVYIFSNEAEYKRYLQATYPNLPNRRAYFVGTADELAVYTFRSDRILEDLRHEYTHGLLHGSLKEVPLWIDEGLAEYFEVQGAMPGTINPDYARRLTASLANGWRPSLKRLENIGEFSQMQHVDYQESWAWVHYMLHSSPETKEALLSYLQDLRTKRRPTLLSDRLDKAVLKPRDRFVNYVATLPMARVLSTGSERPQATGTVLPVGGIRKHR